MANLPRGASDDRDLARRIASDRQRLAGVASAWTKRYAELGETVFDTGRFDSPGLRFAAELTDDPLADLAPDTRGLVAAGEAAVMMKRAGCLMSLAEISKHVEGSAESAETVATKLLALQTGGAQAEDLGLPRIVDDKQIALAILYVRELFDVVRRFAICLGAAQDHDLDVAEMLALYRREGGFVIAPPVSTYRSAPLIATTSGGCRINGSPVWDSTTKRFGFVISHDRASPRTPSKDDPVSRSFGLMIRNIVALAGVDTVIMPRLPAADELIAALGAALGHTPRPAPLDELRRDVLARLSRSPLTRGTLHGRQNSIASQADIFDGLSVGLLMLRIEEIKLDDSLPAADVLFEKLKDDMTGLLAAHPASSTQGGKVFVDSDDDGSDTRFALRLGASWYASRRRVDSLLARRDRTRQGELDRFSPFLGYLRYHLGDVSFMGAIIRFLSNFEALVKEAKKRPARWPRSDEFLQTAGSVVWSRAETRAAAPWSAHWRTVGGETAWRHHGLLAALRANALSAPWLSDAERALARAPASSIARMTRTADTAFAAVKTMEDKTLWEEFDVLLRTAPVKLVTETFPLIGLADAGSRRRAMAKAHNFEQLRIVYQQAAEASGATPAVLEGALTR